MNFKITSRALVIVSFLTTAVVLSSCNDATPTQAPSQVETVAITASSAETPNSEAAPTSFPKTLATPTPVKAVGAYPSCVNSDPNHICIGLKMVSYQDSSGVPVISEADSLTMIDSMNAIWSQCNIAFQLEVYQSVDQDALNLSYSPDWHTESDIAREQFKDPARFLVIAVGPWSSGTIAVTQMPETGLYGTMVDKQYSHNAMTVGHELGHYQGLYHVNDTGNLMSAYIGSNTKSLDLDQCTAARATDNLDWQMMMRKPI